MGDDTDADRLEISWNLETPVLAVNAKEVALPGCVRDCHLFEDTAICRLATDTTSERPEFELPAPSRNVVAITGDGDCEWIIDELPVSGDQGVYSGVSRFHDRFVSERIQQQGDERRWVEFDPRTGTIEEVHDGDSFRLQGDQRTFANPISEFHTFDDVAVIVEETRSGRGTPVTAFDCGESQHWNGEFSGRFWPKDGELLSLREPQMGVQIWIEHSLETGEPITIYDAPTPPDRDTLKPYVPENLWQQIDDLYGAE